MRLNWTASFCTNLWWHFRQICISINHSSEPSSPNFSGVISLSPRHLISLSLFPRRPTSLSPPTQNHTVPHQSSLCPSSSWPPPLSPPLTLTTIVWPNPMQLGIVLALDIYVCIYKNKYNWYVILFNICYLIMLF